ncbi:MAG: hypothetical protein QF909_03080, partial [SAR202 cluster bacterium]|nr:hypothetical protein [SAR202 cluster bacterium]
RSTLYQQTEGNPLFVTEVVKLLAEEGNLDSDEDVELQISIPDGVRDVISRRLNHLPRELSAGSPPLL